MNRRKFLGASALIGISTYLSPRTLLSNPVKKSKLKLNLTHSDLGCYTDHYQLKQPLLQIHQLHLYGMTGD